jgi:hypothetical protein
VALKHCRFAVTPHVGQCAEQDDRFGPKLAALSAWTAIVVAMAAAKPFDASPVPTLPPDTSPTAIRDALIDEERAQFERAYHQALAEAAKTLDLTRVLDVLRNYHRIAWLTQQQGPETHRRMLNKAVEILRTGENPDGVALTDVKALIRDRLAQ